MHCRRWTMVAATLLIVSSACRNRGEGPPVFRLLEPTRTGVTFANTITTDDSLNVQSDPYIYNGAGVAVGDFDNDGRPDIFLAGNQVTSRLYHNLGGMRFEDVTARAGVTTDRWATGVSLVDIDGDGWLDIYVSVSGPAWTPAARRANLLFVNNRNGTFTESAAKYGIADTGFTTHAAFLDYDGDGCLDLFLLENSPQDFRRSDMAVRAAGGVRGSYSQLYRNDCHGHFTNVSEQAGMLAGAVYGLGVAVGDFNRDGRPDIYVSSDIDPNDLLFVNNGDGTFTDRSRQWLRHTSYAGMGVDVADIDNDGWPDVLQVDMMPPALRDRKRMSGFVSYEDVLRLRQAGRRLDYDANALQHNVGPTPDSGIAFSEIGRLAGVAYTDWSWSALLADFDDDGWKDVFITSGYPKAVNNLDYQTAAYAAMRAGHPRDVLALVHELPGYRVPSRVFRNDHDLAFTDRTTAWGLDHPGFSYGAAYADLNGDGKLDLVVNNIDAPASIYQNVAPADSAHHALTVRLRGDAPNTGGIGATLILTARGAKQYLYHSPYRGFMSTVDADEHFGLGGAARADSLEVFWPDGRYQLLTGVAADRAIVVRQADARERRSVAPPTRAERPFTPLDARHRPAYRDVPALLSDLTVQPSLPYSVSSHGPPLAVADVNGDGLEDVFVGGGAGQPGALFLQRADGSFQLSNDGQPWLADAAQHDAGAIFFDANGDGRPDLYVSSCDYQLVPGSPLLQDRLYINAGDGRFVRDTAALPEMRSCTETIRAGDYDGDGRPDLFVAGRMTPRKYPFPARSYLLHNEGGRFTDVTARVAPELVSPGGMITDAAWVDFDGDGHLDLVTVGEWMPVRFFRSEGTRFRDVTSATGLPPLRGWWYSLAVGDFDHDGRPDLVAGNLGLNSTFTTSDSAHLGVYAGNLGGSATARPGGAETSADVLLTTEVGRTEVPFAGLATLGGLFEQLTRRYPSYGAFADASAADAFGADRLAQALHYQADTFASMYLHNDGHGRFTASLLPMPAQVAPMRAIVVQDVDGDGQLDLVVAGNLHDTDPNTPPADAGSGLWLRGDGRGHFTPVSPPASGLYAPLDVSGLALLHTPTGRAILVANTGDSLQAFAIRPKR